MARHRHDIVLGWILLLLGGFLLLDHWYPHLLGWNAVLVALGVAFLIRGVTRSKGAVFPGTFLLLLGLFFVLKEADVIYVPWWQHWTLVLLFLGVSFVVLYVADPVRRGALLTGILLIALAFLFLRSPYGWDDVIHWLGHWWPVILILIGLRMVWKTAASRRSQE